MATLLNVEGVRIHVPSNDHDYPAHVHAQTGGCKTKWTLDPIECVKASRKCIGSDLAKVRKIMHEHLNEIWERWREEFRRRQQPGL